VIAPHAGYRYSGPTAAYAYRVIREHPPKRVVVLGPSHRGAFAGLSIAEVTHYRTPLGDIPLDLDAIAQLRKSPLVTASADAHAQEHSIEMQLPLLQRAVTSEWTLIPILVGGLAPDEVADAAELIRPLADDDTLIVASGDFTHYGPGYGYLPFPNDDEIAERLRALDMGAYEQIQRHDASGFLAYRDHTGLNACATGPVAILLDLLGPDSTPTLLRYFTSGELVGDYETSVSYLAVAITDPKPLASGGVQSAQLGEGDMKLLHRLACATVERAVMGGAGAASIDRMTAGLELPDSVRKEQGAFVTLTEGGALRGCIGTIRAVEPLFQSVVHNAVNASLDDPRFQPVTPRELPQLEVEVSVLSPMRPIGSYREIELGTHGVLLTKGDRRAVFLPEVATEQGWTLDETLSHLSRKAGLPEDAWKDGATFEVFTSQIYKAPFRGASRSSD